MVQEHHKTQQSQTKYLEYLAPHTFENIHLDTAPLLTFLFQNARFLLLMSYYPYLCFTNLQDTTSCLHCILYAIYDAKVRCKCKIFSKLFCWKIPIIVLSSTPCVSPSRVVVQILKSFLPIPKVIQCMLGCSL